MGRGRSDGDNELAVAEAKRRERRKRMLEGTLFEGGRFPGHEGRAVTPESCKHFADIAKAVRRCSDETWLSERVSAQSLTKS